jgi:hypothetical protein
MFIKSHIKENNQGKWLFVVLCGYSNKNQRGLELKIILSIGNDEEPGKYLLHCVIPFRD